MALKSQNMEEYLEVAHVLCSGLTYIWFHLILISALWREGSLAEEKTKAQAKSVWLIQVPCASLSDSSNSFMIYPGFMIQA